MSKLKKQIIALVVAVTITFTFTKSINASGSWNASLVTVGINKSKLVATYYHGSRTHYIQAILYSSYGKYIGNISTVGAGRTANSTTDWIYSTNYSTFHVTMGTK